MPNRATWTLPADLDAAVRATLRTWTAERKVERLWARDAALWTGADEAKWLGWLDIVDEQLGRVDHFERLAEDVRQAGVSHVLLLGMGGSSLCPDLLRATFGKAPGFPELLVLDSTDPAQVRAFESRVDLGRTLFIVSSKSGTTLEPNIFKEHFFERAKQAVGPDKAGDRFVAITDPGSQLAEVARAERFRHVLLGRASIGGRYSALSDFGLVPAAFMGLDVARLLAPRPGDGARLRRRRPRRGEPRRRARDAPGVLALRGRDKVTLVASPGIRDLGAWLEQLLAESTGKAGTGLIPVDREPLGPPEVYGPDRLFVYLRLDSAPDAGQDEAVASARGTRASRWSASRFPSRTHLGRGVLPLGVRDRGRGRGARHQPVRSARRRGEQDRDARSSPPSSRRPARCPRRRRSRGRRAPALRRRAQRARARGHGGRDARGHPARAPRAHSARRLLGAAGLHRDERGARGRAAGDPARASATRRRVATCLGFGPRFLHSTGQAYKGGPNSGVFLQITCDDAQDLPVPGQRYTFGVVKAAQARGDFEVLAERGRRALRVHLGPDVPAGLATLAGAIAQAVG